MTSKPNWYKGTGIPWGGKGIAEARAGRVAISFLAALESNPSLPLNLLQRHRPLPAGAPAIQPHRQGHVELLGDLWIAQPLRQGPPCLDPQLAQAVADAQQIAGVAQVMQQLAIHLRHEVAGGAVAEAGIKADGALAQALIGRAEQVVSVQLPALGKAPCLAVGQAQVLAGKGPLGVGHRPAGSRRHRLSSGAGGYPRP